MTLQTQIKDHIKAAMLAKESMKLNTLRGISAAMTNELVATKRKPDADLSDEEVLNVIRKQVKQRKDSIEQFRKGGREELAAAEEAEMKVLEAYLPQMMSKEDIKVIAETKKTEMGATDKSKMGVLMGAVMKELKGKADGADVKEVVENLFN